MAIPWIPLLALGAQFLGGAMGKTSNQSSSEVTDSIIQGTTGQVSSGSNTTNQTQSGTTNQQSTDTGTGATSETVNRLDETTQALLTTQVQKLLSSGGAGTSAIKNQLESIGAPGAAFDPNAFVGGIMQSANANAGSDFGSGVNNIRSRIGANSGSNSMAALLEGKLQRDTTANLAGIESNARGTAAQIQQQDLTSRAGATAQLAGAEQTELQGLISSLLNATQRSTGASTTQNVGNTTQQTQQTATETGTQEQKTLGTTGQKTNSVTNANASGQEQDWTKLMENVGKMFSANF